MLTPPVDPVYSRRTQNPPKEPGLPGGDCLSLMDTVRLCMDTVPSGHKPEKVAQNLADTVNDTACALEVQHTSLNINS